MPTTYAQLCRSQYSAWATDIDIPFAQLIFSTIAHADDGGAGYTIRYLCQSLGWAELPSLETLAEGKRKYNYEYLGELCERANQRLGNDMPKHRALALAVGFAGDAITEAMYEGQQRKQFVKRIERMAKKDFWLQCAHVMLCRSLQMRSAYEDALLAAEYTKTEQLLFLLEVLPPDRLVYDLFKPQILALLGPLRTIQLYGNAGLITNFASRYQRHLEADRKKDAATFKSLLALHKSYVKPGSPHHKRLLQFGYTSLEAAYLNLICALQSHMPKRPPQKGATLCKIATQFCAELLAADEIHPEAAYSVLTVALAENETYGTKCHGYKSIYKALHYTYGVQIPNPATFARFYSTIPDSTHRELWLYDVLSPQWLTLKGLLDEKQLLDLFERWVDSEQPGDTKAAVERFEQVAGIPYSHTFREHTSSYRFSQAVHSGCITLRQIFEENTDYLADDFVLASDEEGEDGEQIGLGDYPSYIAHKHLLNYIREELNTAPDVYSFLEWLYASREPAQIHSLYEKHSFNLAYNTYWESIYYVPEPSPGSETLKFCVPCFSPEQIRSIYGWLEDYLFNLRSGSYISFLKATLCSPKARELFGLEALRSLYEAVNAMNPDVFDRMPHLQETYMTDAEREARAAAELARQQQQEEENRRLHIRRGEELFHNEYGCDIQSLDVLCQQYSHVSYFPHTTPLIHTALGEILGAVNHQLTQGQYLGVLSVCGQLIEVGCLSMSQSNSILSKIKEVTKND